MTQGGEHGGIVDSRGPDTLEPMQHLHLEEHPHLELGVISARRPEGRESAEWLTSLLRLEAESPFEREEEVRAEVRNLLRYGGYKPTGRGKPASEYLVRAAGEGKLSSINPWVDVCNVVSLHSGLPISVVDADLLQGALKVGLAPKDSSYVFNASGQEIRLDGLLCLFDEAGPCANGVKDSQRTKTHAETQRSLSLIWGTRALPGRCESALHWYRDLLERAGFTEIVFDRMA